MGRQQLVLVGRVQEGGTCLSSLPSSSFDVVGRLALGVLVQPVAAVAVLVLLVVLPDVDRSASSEWDPHPHYHSQPQEG